MINWKNWNKKVTSNQTEHVEAEKKLTDVKKKVAQISEKGYDFLLVRKSIWFFVSILQAMMVIRTF